MARLTSAVSAESDNVDVSRPTSSSSVVPSCSTTSASFTPGCRRVPSVSIRAVSAASPLLPGGQAAAP